MTLQRKILLTLKKPCAEIGLYLSPQRGYAKRIQPGKGIHGLGPYCLVDLVGKAGVAWLGDPTPGPV